MWRNFWSLYFTLIHYPPLSWFRFEILWVYRSDCCLERESTISEGFSNYRLWIPRWSHYIQYTCSQFAHSSIDTNGYIRYSSFYGRYGYGLGFINTPHLDKASIIRAPISQRNDHFRRHGIFDYKGVPRINWSFLWDRLVDFSSNVDVYTSDA